VAAVNTQDAEGWPALRPDGKELWFTRNFGLWRSKSVGGEWQPPELILSPLAGEASLDEAGNVYFVHHFYKDDQMLEADIYVAYKKRTAAGNRSYLPHPYPSPIVRGGRGEGGE
jgi:hypothetical protein